MRKLLLVFLLFPFYSFAQLELGINEGISPFHVVKYHDAGSGLSKPRTGSIAGITATYKFGGLKLGLGYNSSTLFFNSVNNSSTYYYAKPMGDIYLSADYEWQINPVASLYLGIHVGATTVKNSDYLLLNADGTGTSYGAHIGYSHRIYKGLWVNGQVGFMFADNTFDRATPGYTAHNETTILTYPFTLGIRYQFHFRHHKKPAVISDQGKVQK